MTFHCKDFNDLRSWRKRGLGLPVLTMSDKFKISTFVICNAEHGRLPRRPETIEHLARAYGLTVTELRRMVEHGDAERANNG